MWQTQFRRRCYRDSYSQNAAENYERYFVPSIGRPVAADVVDAATLRPGERVLDVACGTGIVARRAAERVGPRGTVEGLDPNPGMLAVASQVAALRPLHRLARGAGGGDAPARRGLRRSLLRNNATVAELETVGPPVSALIVDVSDESQCQSAVRLVLREVSAW